MSFVPTIYGLPPYGTVPYGRGPSPGTTSAVFLAPLFRAFPIDTGSDSTDIHLQWVLPTNTGGTLYTQMILVRNNYNTPIDQNDGLILLNYTTAAAISAAPVVFLDTTATQGDEPELYNYYSIFLWDNANSKWVRSADAKSILPVNYGYGERLFSLLPQFYRDQDSGMVDPGETGPLEAFLGLVGFELNWTRTLIESLRDLSDPFTICGDCLPYLASDVGLTDEPFLGMRLTREQVSNITHLYKTKGSVEGLLDTITTFTDYRSRYSLGPNLLLDQNNSSYSHSTGLWLGLSTGQSLVEMHGLAGVGTFSSPPAAGLTYPVSMPLSSISGEQNTLDPTIVSTSMLAVFFPSASGTVKLSSIGAPVYPGGPVSSPRNGGIPVLPGDIYTLSVYLWEAAVAIGTSVTVSPTRIRAQMKVFTPHTITTNATSNTVAQEFPAVISTRSIVQMPQITVGSGHQYQMKIVWYDLFENTLSTSTGPATGFPLSSASPPSGPLWNRMSFTATAPANAAWASFNFQTVDTLGVNDPVYLSWWQFEDSNLIPSFLSSFEDIGTPFNPTSRYPYFWNLNGITVTAESIVEASTLSTSFQPAPDGNNVWKIDYTNSSPIQLTSPPTTIGHAFVVTGGTVYTVTGTFQLTAVTTPVTLQVLWYDQNQHLISNSTASGMISTGVYTTLAYNFTSPYNASYVQLIWIVQSVTGSLVSAETLVVDAIGLFVGPNQVYSNAPAPYSNPKDIQIHFTPVRSNLVTNPSFEGTVGAQPYNWGPSSNYPMTLSTLTGTSVGGQGIMLSPLHTQMQVGLPTITSGTASNHTTVTPPVIRTGMMLPWSTPSIALASTSGSFFLQTVSTGTTGVINSTLFPIYETGVHYTLSFQTQAATHGARMEVQVWWFDQSGAAISNILTSTGFFDSVGKWTLFDSSLYDGTIPWIAPSNAAYAQVSIWWIVMLGTGETHFVDSVLFEPSLVAQPFFSAGSPNTAQTGIESGETFWSGASQKSQSFYFPDFTTRQPRLAAILPDFLPLGSTFSFIYTQP